MGQAVGATQPEILNAAGAGLGGKMTSWVWARSLKRPWHLEPPGETKQICKEATEPWREQSWGQTAWR